VRYLKSDRVDSLLIRGYILVAVIFWLVNPAAFISEDSYFYPVIARNIALTGEQTFSGLYPTNGVHPLWLYLLSGWAWLVSLIDAGLLYRPEFGVPLAAALLYFGAQNFRRVAERLGVSPLPLVLVPVCYLTMFGVLYSEAHAYYFALSLLTRLSVESRDGVRGREPLIGVAAALVFLARLDSVFFVAAFYVWRLIRERELARVAISGVVSLAVALAYLLSNQIWFGGFTPISGWLKSSFPGLTHRGFAWARPLIVSWEGYHILLGILPIVAAVAVVLFCRRRITGTGTLVYVYLAGSVMHFIYVALFTVAYTTWYWYYVLPVTLLALSASILLAAAPRKQLLSRLVAGAAVVGALFVLVQQRTTMGLEGNVNSRSYRTLQFALNRRLDDKVILVSEWPGVIAFYTNNRIIAADMLTSNRRLFAEMRSSGNALDFILDDCEKRGRPVDYVIFNAGKWLRPDGDLRTLTYNDPKLMPREVEFGALEVGRPMLELRDPLVVVWRLGSRWR